MYALLLWVCSIASLASVPLILAAHARRPQHMPWWLVVALAAALGWIASNLYVCLEGWQIQAARDELGRQDPPVLADFFVAALPSFTVPWGWTVGIVYLIVCMSLYTLFRGDVEIARSRPLAALLVTGVGLAIFNAIPPWTSRSPARPYDFVVLYAFFLTCAGLSYQLLRVFRLSTVWSAFVVMFVVAFALDLALETLAVALEYAVRTEVSLQIRESAEWAVLLSAVFTAFWWTTIRKRPSDA